MAEKPEIRIFPLLPVEISMKEVLHLLGYRKKSALVSSAVEAKVERELSLGRQLLRFKGVYLKSAAKVYLDRVVLESGFTINSERFVGWVSDCEAVYLFAVTAGPLLSERTSELLARGEVSQALVSDAVGSAAGEACARAANEYIESRETENRLSKRYSPGYGDWKVGDNRQFIEFLEAKQVGLAVNEGGLMQPEKSVSAAIGVWK